MTRLGVLFCGLALVFASLSCERKPTSQSTFFPKSTDTVSLQQAPPAPEWAYNATIYEINLRHFSEEGTFKAVEAQLTRLKEMGVDILWLMPVYPISKVNRKGSLGSPYAVQDYLSVNPDYGTLDEFKAMVRRAHDLGLRVIMDWSANHTGWDHPWVKQHPDWYTQINGRLISPYNEKGDVTDRTDVVDLNYNNRAMRRAMLDAMKFWVRECDVDGYRCEVANLVPDDFWASARTALDSTKTVFLLAESEDKPSHFKIGFNANYAWATHGLMVDIARGLKPATALDSLLDVNRRQFPVWYYQMYFTQHHDINTRIGTSPELFGGGADAFTVLTCTFDGMPLIYNGMEANLSKRLKFYDKDPIYWGNYAKQSLFKTLLTLKHRNRALWNGQAGGPLVKIATGVDDKVYAFYRQKDDDKVVVIINLSPLPQMIRLSGEGYEGMYTDVFNRQPTELKNAMTFALKPWEYKVFTN